MPYEPFTQTLRDFGQAWTRYFKSRRALSAWYALGCKGKRPLEVGVPHRRKYGAIRSARFTIDQRRGDRMVDRERGSLALPRLGAMRFRATKKMEGRLRSVTISRDAAGRWFASFTADHVPSRDAGPAKREAVGIDMGLKATAVFSTGEVVKAGRYLAVKQARLRRYQRHYARQRDAAMRRQGLDPRKRITKGTRITPSNRMVVAKRRIGALHARIADARRNHLHQISYAVTRMADVVCIEDLAVRGMGRAMRRGFRRSVADAAMGELRRQITYKAAWRGRAVSVVGRYYPSSKTCHVCGAINHALTLRDRRWTCASCGTVHDRDLNAALNIEREGLRLLASECTPRIGGIDAP